MKTAEYLRALKVPFTPPHLTLAFECYDRGMIESKLIRRSPLDNVLLCFWIMLVKRLDMPQKTLQDALESLGISQIEDWLVSDFGVTLFESDIVGRTFYQQLMITHISTIEAVVSRAREFH